MAVYYVSFWTTVTLTFVLSLFLVYRRTPAYKVRRFAAAGFYFATFFIDLNEWPPQIAVSCHQFDFCPQMKAGPVFLPTPPVPLAPLDKTRGDWDWNWKKTPKKVPKKAEYQG
jgi:hypothetical protein